MIPKSIICSGLDDGCVRLFAYLDMRQGANGWAHRGTGTAGQDLGWQERTVSNHVDHLVEAGIVRVERDGEKSKKVLVVVHSPARKGRTNRNAIIPPAKVLAKKVKGRQPFEEDQGGYRRQTNDNGSPAEQLTRGAVSAPEVAREAQILPMDRGAADAPRPRSPRSEQLSPLETRPLESVEQSGTSGLAPEPVVRGRCSLCADTERWLLFNPDGVELRFCDTHLFSARRMFPESEAVDLELQPEELERPFVVPPEGAIQAALRRLHEAFPGLEEEAG